MFLVPSLALCAAVQLACDPQVGADYQGEPLGSISGQVSTRDAGGSTDANVAVLWFSSSDQYECEGPSQACAIGAGGPEDQFECIEACGHPFECDEEILTEWKACVDACGGEASADFSVSWELCVDSAVGEMVPVTGQFPAAFTLDLFQPPPEEALLTGEDGLAVAFGWFIAADDDLSAIDFSAIEDAPPEGIVGGSETHVLIYAAQDVPADSPWGEFLGGAYTPGYHVVQVVQGMQVCDVPDNPDNCWFHPPTLAPAPNDLATEIELVLGSFYDIAWPVV